jgi:hypothetical protein
VLRQFYTLTVSSIYLKLGSKLPCPFQGETRHAGSRAGNYLFTHGALRTQSPHFCSQNWRLLCCWLFAFPYWPPTLGWLILASCASLFRGQLCAGNFFALPPRALVMLHGFQLLLTLDVTPKTSFLDTWLSFVVPKGGCVQLRPRWLCSVSRFATLSLSWYRGDEFPRTSGFSGTSNPSSSGALRLLKLVLSRSLTVGWLAVFYVLISFRLFRVVFHNTAFSAVHAAARSLAPPIGGADCSLRSAMFSSLVSHSHHRLKNSLRQLFTSGMPFTISCNLIFSLSAWPLGALSTSVLHPRGYELCAYELIGRAHQDSLISLVEVGSSAGHIPLPSGASVVLLPLAKTEHLDYLCEVFVIPPGNLIGQVGQAWALLLARAPSLCTLTPSFLMEVFAHDSNGALQGWLAQLGTTYSNPDLAVSPSPPHLPHPCVPLLPPTLSRRFLGTCGVLTLVAWPRVGFRPLTRSTLTRVRVEALASTLTGARPSARPGDDARVDRCRLHAGCLSRAADLGMYAWLVHS